MKVLKNNDTVELDCPNCKSVLGVEWDDIETDDICHGRPGEFWVCCPCCGKTIGLNRGDFPNRWLPLIMSNNNIED